MKYTVYKTTNKLNNKIYIGVHQTVNPNDNYLGSGKILQSAIKKYGVDNFTKEILFIFDTPEEMFNKEAELVNEDFIARTDTYNIKVGGEGSWDYVNNNPECRNGFEINPENIQLGHNAWKSKFVNDKKFQDRIKYHLSVQSLKGTKILKELYPDGTWKGRRHTEESKQKIGEANKVHQRGEGNSQYGTCWIYSLESKRSQKIPTTELDSWLKRGWIKGRKLKF